MDNGFIKLYRQLLCSEIFASQIGLKIWIWCLLKANYVERFIPVKVGRGETTVKVERGSFLFGRFMAEEELNIDGSTVYKWIKKLEDMGMVEVQSSSHYSIVTICKYEEYQQQENEEVAAIQQQSSKQVATKEQPRSTTKNVKNIKNNIYFGETPVMKIHSRCKNYFLGKYEELFGENYYWEAKDGANLNPIIKKIKFNRERKHLPVDDDSILSAFEVFIGSIKDGWLLSNFSITNINSKFNEIVSQAKINKNGKKETESNIVDI